MITHVSALTHFEIYKNTALIDLGQLFVQATHDVMAIDLKKKYLTFTY